jgi:hypothetical protein
MMLLALHTHDWTIVERLHDEIVTERLRRAAEFPRPMGAL